MSLEFPYQTFPKISGTTLNGKLWVFTGKGHHVGEFQDRGFRATST